jgi:hypothetical protein
VPRRCSVEDGNPVRAAHRGLAIEHERARPELRSRPRDRRIAVAPVVTPSGELAPLNETSIVKEPGSVLGQMPVALRLVAALVAVRLVSARTRSTARAARGVRVREVRSQALIALTLISANTSSAPAPSTLASY